MDGLSELPKATRVQPVFDAPFFGAPLPERPPPPQLPLAAYRTQRPFADPRLFWVLRKGEPQPDTLLQPAQPCLVPLCKGFRG
jgi:hypothetical protein